MAPAAAQEMTEIVVTAQKREQALIDVPAAVTAIGGDLIQQQNLSNMPAVATQVPNFSIFYGRGSNATPDFNIRGVSGDQLPGRLNESSVAVYTDDVYLGDENILNASLFDLQRVEVLRGPQGNLFGRNTTAGLVHFISASPTRELSGYGSLLYGEDNAIVVEGGVSGPISDHIRARISGKWDSHDGHLTNKYQGAGQNGIPKKLGKREIYGFRGILDIDLSEQTTLRLIGNYGKNNSVATPIHVVGTLKPGTPGATAYTRAQQCTLGEIYAGQCISGTQAAAPSRLPNTRNGPGTASSPFTNRQMRADGEAESYTAKLSHEFDWATLTSIANYAKSNFYQGIDAGYATPTLNGDTSALQPRINHARQFSEELRLNGSSDAIDWVLGAFYYTDKKRSSVLLNIANGFLTSQTDADVKSRSYALFGQIDGHITEEVTLTIGARYTGDRRELIKAQVFDNRGNFQDVRATMIARGAPVKSNNKDMTGKIGVSWEPSDDATYYASFSRGIKGAGFNNGFGSTNVSSPVPATAAAAQNANVLIAGPVPQEVLDAFELGAKNRFLDRRLTINSALFLYRYTGKQVTVPRVDPVSGLASFNYVSVGQARAWGAETEILFRPDDHWDLSVVGAFTRSKIVDSALVVRDGFGVPTSLEGKRLINTPKWTVNATLGYHLPLGDAGTFTPQVEVYHKATWNSSLVNDPLGQVPGYTLTNFRILWESADGRFNGQAFMTNAFNVKHALLTTDTVVGQLGKLLVQEGEGRLWGVKVGVRF